MRRGDLTSHGTCGYPTCSRKTNGRFELSKKSELAQAIRYARSNWAALTRYRDDGRLEVDTPRGAPNRPAPHPLIRKPRIVDATRLAIAPHQPSVPRFREHGI